jgi:hypothetical protein
MRDVHSTNQRRQIGRAYLVFKERIRTGGVEPSSEHLTGILVSSNRIVRGIDTAP